MSAYSKEAEKFDHLREALVIETNKNKFIPVNYSIYKKTPVEKGMIKHIKSMIKMNIK